MKHEATTTDDSSPPSKKARPADFRAVVNRSLSVSENGMYQEEEYKGKVFNDSVHGHISFPAVAVAIIDTPQFQRLRHLYQVSHDHSNYFDPVLKYPP